jgi:hypothetical protein
MQIPSAYAVRAGIAKSISYISGYGLNVIAGMPSDHFVRNHVQTGSGGNTVPMSTALEGELS